MGKRGAPVLPAGSMRQRSPGSWELRAYAGVDARSGRERYVTRTVFGGRVEAAKALKELVAVARSGPSEGAGATFAVLLQAWMDAKEPRWSKTTMSQTRSIVRCHLIPGLGEVPLGALTTAQLDGFLADLGREQLSAGTVNRVRSVAHAALAQAVRWEWIWSNPASRAGKREETPRAHDVPAPAVVTGLMASLSVTDPALMLLVRLASTTGARRGELLGLSWADVDLERGRLRLVHGLVDAAGGPVLQLRKTRNASCLDLDAQTLELLRAHRKVAGERADRQGVAVERCPVFSMDRDVRVPWKPNWASKRFRKAMTAVGLPHFRFHDLRHFVATNMLASGVALPVVAARLGHARASTTLNIYAASMPGWDRAAAETISDLLRAG